ncbi:glycoside hydrolase family 127 protein [candidate division KSB1 bacterium]|nr:glycoside hydrolase family 127 protein [candidate division KSB1 bacterium]
MKKNYYFTLLFILISCSGLNDSVRDYPITPVPFSKVKITDSFWQRRVETSKNVTIPYAFDKCDATGRILNFEIAAGLKTGEYQTDFPFDDSDVYKIIEGASYSLMHEYDETMDAYLDTLIELIGKAQEEDGYILTWRQIDGNRPPTDWSGKAERWSDLDGGHELYTFGHMYEAAAAHFEATGKRSFLDIALKNADLVSEVFGEGKNEGYPGHQEIEIGLIKLYRATGDKTYLDQAKLFLDRRGRKEAEAEGDLWQTRKYWQDHKPVVEQTEAVGHAVRAGYMYTAMTDIAALTGDVGYLTAVQAIWNDMVNKKYYITGGVGGTAHGEAYTDAYILPNETAYCETCASIAVVYWNYRMFLLTGDSRYYDVLERTLYNGLISGVSLEGDRFFYPNRLESKGEERSEWFDCSCCPSNISRFIPSVGGYIYAQQNDKFYINLYIGSEVQFDIDGKKVDLVQKTDFPWEGTVAIDLNTNEKVKANLLIRIPGWIEETPVEGDLYRYIDAEESRVTLRLNDELVDYSIVDGFASIEREWSGASRLTVEFPLNVRRVIANENVQDDRGKVAINYGPLVYCVEASDNRVDPFKMKLPSNIRFEKEFKNDLLHGVLVVNGFVDMGGKRKNSLTAIPYYAHAHRGKGPMRVWLPAE